MVAECVVNSDCFQNPLETARKVNAYICKECGLSKEDLPEVLQTKFEEFAHSAEGGSDATANLGYLSLMFSGLVYTKGG